MESSIFESPKEKPKNKKVSIIIPLELNREIYAVVHELKRKSPELKFNIDAICINALNKAVKKAQRELETMKKVTTPLPSAETTAMPSSTENAPTTTETIVPRTGGYSE